MDKIALVTAMTGIHFEAGCLWYILHRGYGDMAARSLDYTKQNEFVFDEFHYTA